MLSLRLLAFSCLFVVGLSMSIDQDTQRVNLDRKVQKKSFSSIGCLGNFDKDKYSRLDRICDECYQIYRDSDINQTCREFCFKNDVFTACVDALLLKKEQKELNTIVEELLG